MWIPDNLAQGGDFRNDGEGLLLRVECLPTLVTPGPDPESSSYFQTSNIKPSIMDSSSSRRGRDVRNDDLFSPRFPPFSVSSFFSVVKTPLLQGPFLRMTKKDRALRGLFDFPSDLKS